MGSQGIRIGPSNELSAYSKDEQYFVQEFIDGREFTIDVLCGANYLPSLIIPRERLEVKAGVATKVRITNDPNLIELGKRIVEKYPLIGFSNIQFMMKDDRYYFIELNPRFGGMSIASVLASYNYVDEYISALIEGRTLSADLETNMKRVKWGAIVTRYYEEKIFLDRR